MKKYMTVALVLLLGLITAFTSCKEDPQNKPNSDPDAPTLTVSPKEMKVFVGSKETIIAAVTPKGTEITFTSADPTIATVDNAGVVEGIAVGNTTIIVKAGQIKEEVKVQVAPLAELYARMIGTEGNEKAPLFYVPKANEMKESLEVITKANKQYGWLYASDMLGDKFPHEKKGYAFIGITEDGSEFIDDRVIEIVAYEYQHPGVDPANDAATIQLYTKIREDESLFKSEEGKARVKELADLYGFTVKGKFMELGSQHVYIAYNLLMGENEPLELTLLDKPNFFQGENKMRLMGMIRYNDTFLGDHDH